MSDLIKLYRNPWIGPRLGCDILAGYGVLYNGKQASQAAGVAVVESEFWPDVIPPASSDVDPTDPFRQRRSSSMRLRRT